MTQERVIKLAGGKSVTSGWKRSSIAGKSLVSQSVIPTGITALHRI